MNSTARKLGTLFRQPIHSANSLLGSSAQQVQQCRGIRVKVLDRNLDQALKFMENKMKHSGMERMIKREQTHHIKKSEKRVLARKKLELKLGSQEVARKLKAILFKKVRGG